MNMLVCLFSEGTFNKSRVALKEGLYLRYLWDQYRVHLQKNHHYDHPPMIPEVEWKGLMVDANEKKLQKQGKTPPKLGRYEALLIM